MPSPSRRARGELCHWPKSLAPPCHASRQLTPLQSSPAKSPASSRHTRCRPMIRVVKIGGSLFEWPELSAALRRWLFSQPSAFNILIAGGGALADVIRQADRDFSFGDERSHWLCIDALSIS